MSKLKTQFGTAITADFEKNTWTFEMNEDFKVNAIKIGMLGSKELILKVLDCIKPLYIPIILDPVAISRAGSKLIDDEAVETLKTLFKYAFVITPNKYEAKLFFDVNSIDDIKNIKHIPTNILFKNMLEDKNKTVDILLKKDGTIINFESPRANEENTNCVINDNALYKYL